MTPFAEAQTQLKPSLWQRLSAHRAPLVFALCILAGLTWVAWRAKVRLETARATARTEARACGVSLELQFSQTPGAAEALGTMVRQGREGLSNSKWLQEVLSRAQLGELPRQGYDFALFIPPPDQQKPVVIVSRGLASLLDTVQQPIRVKNLELRLALKPRGGWVNKSRIGLESLAVLLISALVALLANLLESRRAMEAELKEASQRLAREATERTQVQAECVAEKEHATAAKAELRQIQAALQQSEAKATQFHSQLDAMVRTRNETAEIHKTELKKAHAALQESQETVAQLRALLNGAAEAEKKTASVARERLQEHQTAMAALQMQLEMAKRSAQETAKTDAVRLAQLERGNRELQERLLVAEKAQERVTELAGLPQRAGEELRHREEDVTLIVSAASAELVDAASRETAGDVPGQQTPVESLDETKSVTPLEILEPPVEVASPSEPSPVPKVVKAGRRRQTRRDDQLALFGNEDSVLSPADQEFVEAEPPPAPASVSAGENSTPVSIAEPQDAPAIESPIVGDEPPSAGDDPENHLSALRLFAEDHAHAPEQIRDALLQGDVTAAQKMVQALQIASDKIGATAVHQAAAALARACHEHSDPGEIELVWSELERGVRELVATFKPVAHSKEAKPTPSRRLPPAPAADPAQLRKAVNLILPLLAERDPGAKDCLKDNRTTFRSTFTPEAYVEFEQLVKSGEFEPALEQLRKAVRKHGISL